MVVYDNESLLEFMPDVNKCNYGISSLNEQWDNLKLLCEINCPNQAKKIMPNMTNIQNSFYDLQHKLVDTLIKETLNKLDKKMILKTQVAIDVLIRNLYERTADVGFIATDDDIQKFVSQKEEYLIENEYILNRLKEYVAKYSVYDEIIILDKEFNVLLNLDQKNNIIGHKIDDSLLQDTISTHESYLENFRFSVLQAHKEKSHIFSSKIRDSLGNITGIICLCFRFEDEVEKIFNKLSGDYDGSVILIVDNDNIVIASSDENHVPVGIKVETGAEGKNNICYYNGIEYITKTVCTQGYQGYFGLGWKGYMMIPLVLAFKEKNKNQIQDIEHNTMAGLMSKADSFSQELNQIVLQTNRINNSLKQIVFNGQILANDEYLNVEYSRLKPLLNSIGKIGVNTSELFDKSIKSLFATVISTSLHHVSFIASLAVDIMDRNLYERSDDCRWWALNPVFRTIMAKDMLSVEDKRELTKILAYVNSLYTVYSNLFLFDKNGRIVAISNPDRNDDIDKAINKDYVNNIINNCDPEKYFVSQFEATDLYDNRYTYIYGASITDIKNSNNTVGGIGIVFDSEFQFKSMLDDSIDSNDGSFAVYIDRKKNIISSTDSSLKTGDIFSMPSEFFNIKNGTSTSEIIIYKDSYYSVGCACSSSYREYKRDDDYKNDILAFVFNKLADCDKTNHFDLEINDVEQSEITLTNNEPHTKLAVFLLNNQLFSFEQSIVLEVIENQNIVPLPGCLEIIRGVVEYNNSYVAVMNTRLMFGMSTREENSFKLLVLKLADNRIIALEVDDISNIIEVNTGEIKQVPQYGKAEQTIKGAVFFQNKVNKSVLILDPNVLLRNTDLLHEELERSMLIKKTP